MPSNNDEHLNEASDSSVLDEVIAEYIRACEAGQPPDRDELLAAHPDLADELREFFANRDQMDQVARPMRDLVTRVLNVRCPHCHNPIELLDEAPLRDISCPSCGSSFSLVGDKSEAHYPNGSKTIGHFELLNRVGVGAFGSVWRARDTKLDRTVAIKIPRRGQLDESETEMFLRDARAAAQLKHPNIVGVHEVGKQNGTIYIVSDFVKGVTLKEWMVAKPPTPREAAELCIKIAKALHHAHESGVIHRDLKPGNIMMDSDGEPHLVDFGLAKREAGEITMTVEGQILGTPAYMSPEQARGEGHTVDRRADIYSLGVILFELLTGELPFRGDKQMLIVQILNDDPPSPRKLNRIVPRDLETICFRCLKKEPLRRYATARDLKDEMIRFLNGKPIVARRSGPLERAIKWARRNRTAAALVAVSCSTALLLISGLIVSNFLIVDALEDRTKALGELRIEEESKRKVLAELTYANDELRGQQRQTREALEREREALARERRGSYQRSVALAHLKFLAGESTRANQILDECPKDLRGFEWHYLKRQCNQIELVSARDFSIDRTSNLGDCLISQYGERVVSARPLRGGLKSHGEKSTDDQYKLTIFENLAYESTELSVIVTDSKPKAIVMSPTGKLVAAANRFRKETRQCEVLVWETQNGNQVCRITLPPQLAVWGMAISHDGQLLVTASSIRQAGVEGDKVRGCDVRLWRIRDGKELAMLPEPNCGAYSVRFSTNDKVVLVGFQMWDVETQSEVSRLPVGAYAVDFDEHFVIAERQKNTFVLRDWKTGETLRTFAGHTDKLTAAVMNADGNRLAVGHNDGTIQIWDLESGRKLRHLRGRLPVSELAFTRYGNRLIVLYDRKALAVWESTKPKEAVFINGGKRGRGFAIACDRDGSRVGWVAEDKVTIKVTNVRSPNETTSFYGNTQEVFSVAFHPNRFEIASAGFDGVKIWALDSGDLLREFQMPERPGSGYMIRVSYSPDGSMVAAAHSRGVTIWDVVSGEIRSHFALPEAWLCSGEFDPSGDRLLTLGRSGQAAIYNLSTKTTELKIKPTRVSPRTAVFNHDGTLFAITGQSAKVFDVDSGKDVVEFVGDSSTTVHFSRDGERLLTAGHGGIIIWDVKTGSELLSLRTKAYPYSAVFAPDSSKIFSCHSDGTIRIWDGTILAND